MKKIKDINEKLSKEQLVKIKGGSDKMKSEAQRHQIMMETQNK